MSLRYLNTHPVLLIPTSDADPLCVALGPPRDPPSTAPPLWASLPSPLRAPAARHRARQAGPPFLSLLACFFSLGCCFSCFSFRWLCPSLFKIF